jgi:hypothetical protein
MTWQPCSALRAMTADGREFWAYRPRPDAAPDTDAGR